MKIFLVIQWFPPEQPPIGYMMYELANDLVRVGHDVTIITGFPNHPSGIVFKGYRKRWFQEEFLDGVRIWRVYLSTSPNRSKLNRFVSFLTFTFSSCWAIFNRGKCDVIFSALLPLSMGLFLPLVARIKGSRLVFNLQDLHPDVPIMLGLIKNTFLIKILKWIESYAYQSADKLTVICDSYKKHVVSKGVVPEKVTVIENWIDCNEIRPGNRMNCFRKKIECSLDDFVVLYAGTIGFVSGAEFVLDVANNLARYRHIKFLFVGEGPMLNRLIEKSKLKGLNNMIFMPFQDRDMINQVQATADLSLVTLLKNSADYSVPSKVLGYMAAGRPIVASVDENSETANQIKKASCGVIVPAEDANKLTEAIIKLYGSEQLRVQLGINGRDYIEKNLSRKNLTGKYTTLFESLICI